MGNAPAVSTSHYQLTIPFLIQPWNLQPWSVPSIEGVTVRNCRLPKDSQTCSSLRVSACGLIAMLTQWGLGQAGHSNLSLPLPMCGSRRLNSRVLSLTMCIAIGFLDPVMRRYLFQNCHSNELANLPPSLLHPGYVFK